MSRSINEEKKETNQEPLTDPLLIKAYLKQEVKWYPVTKLDKQWGEQRSNADAWTMLSEWMIEVTEEIANEIIDAQRDRAEGLWENYGYAESKDQNTNWIDYFRDEEEMKSWKSALANQLAMHAIGISLLYIKYSKMEVKFTNLQLIGVAAMMIAERQCGGRSAHWAYAKRGNMRLDRDKEVASFIKRMKGANKKVREHTKVLVTELEAIINQPRIIEIEKIDAKIEEIREALRSSVWSVHEQKIKKNLRVLSKGVRNYNRYQNFIQQELRVLQRLVAGIGFEFGNHQVTAIAYSYYTDNGFSPSDILKMSAKIVIAETATIIYQHHYSWINYFFECLQVSGVIECNLLRKLKQQAMTLVKASLTCLGIARKKPLNVSTAVLLLLLGHQLTLQQLHQHLNECIPIFDPGVIKSLQQCIYNYLSSQDSYKNLVKAVPPISSIIKGPPEAKFSLEESSQANLSTTPTGKVESKEAKNTQALSVENKSTSFLETKPFSQIENSSAAVITQKDFMTQKTKQAEVVVSSSSSFVSKSSSCAEKPKQEVIIHKELPTGKAKQAEVTATPESPSSPRLFTSKIHKGNIGEKVLAPQVKEEAASDSRCVLL